MIYYTGDIHGQKFEVVRLAKRYNLTREDTQNRSPHHFLHEQSPK